MGLSLPVHQLQTRHSEVHPSAEEQDLVSEAVDQGVVVTGIAAGQGAASTMTGTAMIRGAVHRRDVGAVKGTIVIVETGTANPTIDCAT
jgi:hypothetical protein